MRTIAILVCLTLLAGAVAAPGVSAAEPNPTCVRAPCGGPAEAVEYYRDAVVCAVGKLTGRNC